MSKLDRRTFLASLAIPLVGCNGDEPQKGFLGGMERWNERIQMALFDARALAPELPESAQTPEDDFPEYYIADDVPEPPAGWMLEVGGACERPRRFSLAELQTMARTDLRVRHHCVEGWSAVAGWHGVRVSELARIVGADPRCPYVDFHSFDEGYASCWDRASAMHPQTILAYGMNGKPLPPGHGAPLRLYASVKLGYKLVKYLDRITFTPHRLGGYWEDKGYEWYAGT